MCYVDRVLSLEGVLQQFGLSERWWNGYGKHSSSSRLTSCLSVDIGTMRLRDSFFSSCWLFLSRGRHSIDHAWKKAFIHCILFNRSIRPPPESLRLSTAYAIPARYSILATATWIVPTYVLYDDDDDNVVEKASYIA